MRACIPLFLLLLPSASAATDPLFWPEAQRAFFQDGPALLMTPEQRAALAAMDEAGRERAIAAFLDQDPIPETPDNELRLGIERRQRLAALEVAVPQDARAQLLFLRGRPVRRTVVDCPVAFRPLEIWSYAADAALADLVLYRPTAQEPFRLWLPIDSKRALYTSEMEYWLEQWEADGGGKRLDARICPDAETVDRATGIVGLAGLPVGRIARTERQEDGTTETRVTKVYRWVRPKDRAALVAAPADLAEWARRAALTPVPPEPPRIALGEVEVDFPRRLDQRMVARLLLTLPSPETLGVHRDEGKESVRLVVEGHLEQEGGRVFEQLRVRYRLTPTAAGAPAALVLERPLRPGQSFLARLTVTDETSGAAVPLAKAFAVAAEPQVRLAAASEQAARGDLDVRHGIVGPDTLVLMPPPPEVVLGVYRTDAVVSGDRIKKVVFSVDGQAQLTRTRPPYSAELRLDRLPREQVIRAEGFDDKEQLVASDQLVINQPQGSLSVWITDPPRGAKLSGRLRAKAEVMVPEGAKLEAVEFRVNDQVVGRLTSPPWETDIDVPPAGDTAYLAVVAILEGGATAEDLRFLKAPANLEEIEVDLVELLVTALDGSGHPVRGLLAGDFEVSESGKPQSVTRFEPVDDLALTLGLALDTSLSMAESLAESERAAAGFIKNVLTPRDKSFALAFASRPSLLMPPVDDAEVVALALEDLRAFGATALHDAVLSALYYFRGQKGQRALVLLTDGDDTASHTKWEDVLEYARRSGVAVFPIGLKVSDLKLAVRNKLANLAEATGGAVYFIDRADELEGIYDRIEDELRNRYYLSYYSTVPADKSGLRRIEVRAKRGLKVRTSRGFVR